MNSAQQTKRITITDPGTVVEFVLTGTQITVTNGGGCPVADIFGAKLDSATVTEDQVLDIWSDGFDGDIDEVSVEIYDRP